MIHPDLITHSWEDYLNNEGKEPEYLNTGLYDLDTAIDGLQDSEHIIIAGRPSRGKTALAMDICRNVAKRGHPRLFFTMEMTSAGLRKELSALRPEFRFGITGDGD